MRDEPRHSTGLPIQLATKVGRSSQVFGSLPRFQSTTGIVVADRSLNRITGCRFATAESGMKSADLCVFGGPFLSPSRSPLYLFLQAVTALVLLVPTQIPRGLEALPK